MFFSCILNSECHGFVAAYCKRPLAPVREQSIASRANTKNLHVLWPIRMPTPRLRQSERHVPAAPIRTRELSSRLSGQRRILMHIDVPCLHTHTSRNISCHFDYNLSLTRAFLRHQWFDFDLRSTCRWGSVPF